MAFFNELGKKISQTTQNAVKGTKDLAEISKLNSQISDEQRQINNVYFQIGQKYYETQALVTTDESFAPLCESITASLTRIATYQEEIKQIRGIKKCEGCGAELQLSTAFCSICGYKAQQEEAEGLQKNEEPAANQCPGCGKILADGAAFCTDCGHKI